jgi:hypothetical protein
MGGKADPGLTGLVGAGLLVRLRQVSWIAEGDAYYGLTESGKHYLKLLEAG